MKGVIECMWKLLFSMYDHANVQVSESDAAELMESLLLLLKCHKPGENLNPVREFF